MRTATCRSASDHARLVRVPLRSLTGDDHDQVGGGFDAVDARPRARGRRIVSARRARCRVSSGVQLVLDTKSAGRPSEAARDAPTWACARRWRMPSTRAARSFDAASVNGVISRTSPAAGFPLAPRKKRASPPKDPGSSGLAVGHASSAGPNRAKSSWASSRDVRAKNAGGRSRRVTAPRMSHSPASQSRMASVTQMWRSRQATGEGFGIGARWRRGGVVRRAGVP